MHRPAPGRPAPRNPSPSARRIECAVDGMRFPASEDDGADHYLDVEFKGFYRNPDGSVAGMRQCGLRPVEL